MYKHTHILKIIFHQTDSTPEMIYNTQASNINIKTSDFRCITARSAKAYANQFLTLPNAMYNQSEY